MTVHRYVTLRRIEAAQELMLTTDAALSDIALCCGMSDQAHFTRAFRRLVGETPARWRHSLLATSPNPRGNIRGAPVDWSALAEEAEAGWL